MQPHTQSLGPATTRDLLRPWRILVCIRCIQYDMRPHHHYHADACDLEVATQIDAKMVSGGGIPSGMVRGFHEHNEDSLTPSIC